MAEERFLPGEPDERLYDVLLQYLESAERGDSPDPQELIARHPEFAAELKEYLDTTDRLEGLAAPLRWVTRAVSDGSFQGGDTQHALADRAADAAVPAVIRAKSFGEYEVFEEIGRGGMCVVYKARHRPLNRLVALKMVRGNRLSDDEAVRRFRNEAETVAALDHPNIVPIYEVDEHEGQLFFSMRLLEGGSLKDRLASFGADPAESVRLVIDVARAVDYAHRRGVLHRDLKPSNVLLDAAGWPHVADFGLAKWLGNENDLTQTGALLGTPSYMAPEQASPRPRPRPGAGPGPGRGLNDGVTTAADVYGLGAVLYALLTGGPPFCGPTLLLTLELVRNNPPTPPRSINARVDRDLETVCLKCLEKDPARRYGSAEELAEDLERWRSNEPVRARRATVVRRLLLWSRRHRAWAALVAAVALFVPALIAILTAAVVSVGRERDRALSQEARAETREKEVLRQLYVADMARAHREWLHGDVNALKHLLDDWRPQPGADDLRDCAWRLLEPLQRADPLLPPQTTPAHEGDVYHLAVSPDGRDVASAGKDRTVRVQRRGSRPLILRGHEHEVNWVAFDRQGKRIASASEDETARVWDAATGNQLLRLAGHTGEVVSADFTPDGNTLVTTGKDGTLRQWRMPTGAAGSVLTVSHERVAAMAISPDGRHVATVAKDGYLRVFDLATASLVFEHRLAGQSQCVAYSPDGHSIAAGDAAGQLWLFAARDGEPLRVFPCDNGCAVEGVAFAPDGKTLACCGLHGRVRLWDLRRNQLRRNLDCEDLRVWCATFSPDSRSLLYGAADGAIRTWNLSEAHPARYLPAWAGALCSSLAFSPRGDSLAIAGSNGTISFWDQRTCTERTDAQSMLSFPEKGHYQVRFEPEGAVLSVGRPDGRLERWHLARPGAASRLNGLGRGHQALCYRPGAMEWLVRCEGSQLIRWNATTDQQIVLDAGDERCASAAWSPDGTILALSFAGRVSLLRNGTEKITDLGLSRRPWHSPAVIFSPDNKTVAAADFGGLIRLWDTATGSKGPVLQGRQLAVESVDFSPDGKILATGGDDGTVKIWEVASGRELFTLRARLGGRAFQVAFAPDGSCLAAACENHDGTRDVALWPACLSTSDDSK
jgi:WD40 repeat protein/tRNA A-37 threonylcarbamoyl transferase component Bud32